MGVYGAGAAVSGGVYLWPIIYGIPLSLTDYSVITETNYVGLENFTRAFQDHNFLISLWNSLVYVLIVPVIQIISILMAILVNSRIPGVKMFGPPTIYRSSLRWLRWR